LRSAFAIGFALYLPFLAIDLAVSSILMGLGMFMLSPPVISLPCKLLLFVMVDGWTLVCAGVTNSFR
jgi:flagellar biosynthetic protein FliP